MRQLERALEWAQRGFHVFPLQAGTKIPLEGSRGHLDATRDPEQIQRMWTDAMGFRQEYNVGCCPADGRIVVADLDTKLNRQGVEDWLRMGGQIGGLVVRTPTNGLHVYLKGDDMRTGAGRLAPGVDTRGRDGYVVAPGSVVDGVEYEIINDEPMLDAPQFVVEKLGTRADRDAKRQSLTITAVENDQPYNIKLFEEVCRCHPRAVPGIFHDELRNLACEAVRLAISADKAIEVAEALYLPRCEGLYEDGRHERWAGDMRQSYDWGLGQGDHGINAATDPAQAFDGIVIVPPPAEPQVEAAADVVADILFSRTISEGKALRELPIPYVIKALAGPGDVAAVLGEPGSGKSVLLPYIAMCIAHGVPLFGRKTRRHRVLYFATEDGLGLERRLQVLADEMGDPGDFLRVFPLPMNISANGPDVTRFLQTVVHYGAGAVIVDTLFSGYPETDLTDRGETGLQWIVETSKQVAGLPSRPLTFYGHHVPKGGEGAYGGQQIQAMFSTTMLVEGKLKEARRVTVRKNRMGPDGDVYKFAIASAPVCVDDEGDTITAAKLQLVTAENEQAAKRTEQDGWLAETKTGARVALDVLVKLTDAAIEAGRGCTPAEMMGGGPRARLPRADFIAGMDEYGQFEAEDSPAVRERVAMHILGELKKREFADFDSTDVWVIPR